MTANPYETDRFLQEYLLFHYGRRQDACPYGFVPRELLDFHQRIRRECLLPVRVSGQTEALDLGCGVGRFTFELGRVVDRAIGIDSSRAFIGAARRMAREHGLNVRIKDSGADYISKRIELPKQLRAGRVEFQQGDAADIAASHRKSFAVIAAINLICRLPRPRQFLEGLHQLAAPGGQLVLGSPFTWMEEYTPRAEWLSELEIERLLKPHFKPVFRRDLPFVIREHRRKYQLGISTVRVFLRRT